MTNIGNPCASRVWRGARAGVTATVVLATATCLCVRIGAQDRPKSMVGQALERDNEIRTNNEGLFPRVQRFMPAQQSLPLNVKDFGAVCDGSTDDTQAIERAYNAALNALGFQNPALQALGLTGPTTVYFPPSSGFCRATSLVVPNSWNGWLLSIFDNGLIADSVTVGSNTAFWGRTSSSEVNIEPFQTGPKVEWFQPKPDTQAFVDISGVRDVYFENISFFPENNIGVVPTAVHIHDGPGVSMNSFTFNECDFEGNFVVDTSTPTTVLGFGLRIFGASFVAPGNITIQNFSFVRIYSSFFHKIYIANTGIPDVGDFKFSDILSEGLTNEDFATADASGGNISDITFEGVKLADTFGPSYMFTLLKNGRLGSTLYVKFDMTPFQNGGAGLVDPAANLKYTDPATGQVFANVSFSCFGDYCNTIPGQ